MVESGESGGTRRLIRRRGPGTARRGCGVPQCRPGRPGQQRRAALGPSRRPSRAARALGRHPAARGRRGSLRGGGIRQAPWVHPRSVCARTARGADPGPLHLAGGGPPGALGAAFRDHPPPPGAGRPSADARDGRRAPASPRSIAGSSRKPESRPRTRPTSPMNRRWIDAAYSKPAAALASRSLVLITVPPELTCRGGLVLQAASGPNSRKKS
jgi:hypothetical protein